MSTFIDRVPSFLVPFLTLSYPTATPTNPDSFPDSPYYNTGILDICFVISCIAVMAILRDALRIFLLEPFVTWKLTRDLKIKKGKVPNGNGSETPHANGNGNGNSNGAVPALNRSKLGLTRREAKAMRHGVLRFAEQGWSFVYYTLQWLFGVWIHQHLPTKVLAPADLWVDYPHIPLAWPVKFYYLTQTAFYCHQVFILHAEARRKDHYQMLAHHIITLGLVGLSYFFNFTRVGSLIMVLMDCCDIFLPLAKMLLYIRLRTLADAAFVVFMLSWFITRHVLFLFTWWSTAFDLPLIIDWAPEKGKYLSREYYIIFITSLTALQVIQLVWFTMICRVAYRVTTGQNASDDRSDDEDEASEDEKKNQ